MEDGTVIEPKILSYAEGGGKPTPRPPPVTTHFGHFTAVFIACHCLWKSTL